MPPPHRLDDLANDTLSPEDQGQLQIPESFQAVPGGLSNQTGSVHASDVEGNPPFRRENVRRHGKSGTVLIKSLGSGGRLGVSV